MGVFEEELLEEINWRTGEISILKTIPFLYPFSEEQKITIQKHSIPAMYSLWEGFVLKSFEIYLREINNLNLAIDEIDSNILTHAIDIKCQLSNSRKDFNKKMEFVEEIYQYFNSELYIPPILPTESNINYKVINNILYRFNLQPLPEEPYKKSLNKLLLFRNKIAHGDNSLPVSKSLIMEFSFILQDLMFEIFNRIIEGYTNQTFLRK